MSEDVIQNPDEIPTKEYLKLRRKEAYEEAKSEAKRQKLAAKQALALQKAADQKKKDKEIWKSLQVGSDLEDPEI